MPSRLIWLFVCLLFISQLALAQVTSGTISGIVRDSTGGVIPGVTVDVKNLDTGIPRNTISDEQGRYRAPSLALGSYEVRAQKEGFQTEVRRGIELTVGREATVDVVLQVGAVSQTVQITAEAPLVETTASSVSALVETHQIENLPLNGRSFDNLALLQPGVAISQFQNNNIQSGFTTKLSIRGARPEQNSFLLDGTDIMGPSNSTPGSVGGQSFGVDAVREFRVETGTFSAQYGRAAGGVINVITKSGTNEFHGTAFEFLRNSALDASNFFDNATSSGKAPFKRNQFGASAGGPIRKDKTFFFGNYEGLRDRLSQTQIVGVPTAGARLGNIPDARTGRITQVTVNPAIKPYLDALYPLPNGRDRGDGTGDFAWGSSRPTNEDYFTAKVDHNFSASDSFFGRFTFDNATLQGPSGSVQNTGTGVFMENDRSRNQFLTLQDTHIFSPTVLNSFRFGYNRTFIGLLPLVVGLDASTLGRLAFIPGRPFLMVGSVLSPGGGVTDFGNANLPRVWSWDLAEWSDDVTASRGSHTLKVGGLVKKMLYHQREAKSAGGEYDFGGLSDFLQGLPNRFRGLEPDSQKDVGWKYYYIGWYVQDDIRLFPRLTLNLGMRHEIYTGPTEKYNRLCVLDHLLDAQQRCGGSVFPTDLSMKDFAPKIGFAWDVSGNGRTSVRGGFGIYYDAMAPLWWQSAANGSFPPLSDAELTNPPFPGAWDLVTGGKAKSSFVVGTIGLVAVPSTMQYSLTVQRQISRDFVASVGYAGSQGRHLWMRGSENIVQPTILPDGRKCFNFLDTTGRPNPNCPNGSLARRNPNLGDVRRVRDEANSAYNGLLLGLQKRFGKGLQLQASYTYSKSMDEGSSITTNARQGSATGLMDTDDWRLDHSLSDFDARNNFAFNSTLNLPFGPGKAYGSGLTGVKAQLAEGWQLGLILKAASGSPVTATDSSANWSRSGVTSRIERPDLSPGKSNNPTLGSPDQWFDPTAFAVQTLGFYGNAGRNTIIGPGILSVDFSTLKDTAVPKISEQFRIQFRAEFFNVLNRANFGIPNGAIFDSRGRIQGNAGQITNTTTSSRQIQFGLKFLW